MNQVIRDVLHSFAIDGELLRLEPHKNGHINDTHCGIWLCQGKELAFIHQRINHQIFRDIPQLMRNISAVTEHIAFHREDPTEETLRVIPARSGELFARDSEGNFWRTFNCIPGTVSYDICPNLAVAQQAAAAFARFQRHLFKLDHQSFPSPIPGFQDISARFITLEKAAREDRAGRSDQVRAELDFALRRLEHPEKLKLAIENGEVPIRLVHGDLKINNVLFRKSDGAPVCVIDLDTCMPGTLIYDFGDFLRSAGSNCAEDEADLSKISLNQEIIRALSQSYVHGLGTHLSQGEKELLPEAPALLALSLGVRFLTDYLNGDLYFKTRYPDHNLRRCRAQFQLRRLFEDLTPRLREMLG